MPDDLKFSTINAPGAKTYPITAVTFLLVYAGPVQVGHQGRRPPSSSRAGWTTPSATGQKVAPELQYAPLPDPIKQKAQAKVDALQCNGTAIG